jgi:hypothetical protein
MSVPDRARGDLGADRGRDQVGALHRAVKAGRAVLEDRTGRSGTFAGHQIEGRLRYWIIPNEMILDTGLAYLAKGDFLRNAPNAPDTGDTFYGYLNTTLFF